MTLTLPARRMLLAAGNPLRPLSSLFASGEDGFLFGDWTDLSKDFLLSTGTTGNTAVDADPVGLALDNHSWGGASLATVLAAQTELLVPGSWTMSVGGGTATATESPAGTLNLTGDGTFDGRGDQSITTVAGKTYRLSFTIGIAASGVRVGTSQGGTQLFAAAVFNAGAASLYFVATTATSWVRIARTTASLGTASAISCRLVPGNHILQATTTKRPLWKANSGKPYQSFDGTDDALGSQFLPAAAMTLALAVNCSVASGRMLGGGATTGNKRCRLMLDSSGRLAMAWGSVSEGTSFDQTGVDVRSTNMVAIMTARNGAQRLYRDGALVYSGTSGSDASGGSGPMTLGAENNAGTVGSWAAMNCFAGLVLNREATAGEVTNITRQFRSTMQ